MASTDSRLLSSAKAANTTKKRSALGVGVTTLVTIMVVLLLAAFAVLTLVSARSNLSLSEKVVAQTELYYTADTEATAWYAELNDFVAELEGTADSFEEQLLHANYSAHITNEGELRVTQGFAIDENRTLMVTIAVNDDTTTTIRQWQS